MKTSQLCSITSMLFILASQPALSDANSSSGRQAVSTGESKDVKKFLLLSDLIQSKLSYGSQLLTTLTPVFGDPTDPEGRMPTMKVVGYKIALNNDAQDLKPGRMPIVNVYPFNGKMHMQTEDLSRQDLYDEKGRIVGYRQQVKERIGTDKNGKDTLATRNIVMGVEVIAGKEVETGKEVLMSNERMASLSQITRAFKFNDDGSVSEITDGQRYGSEQLTAEQWAKDIGGKVLTYSLANDKTSVQKVTLKSQGMGRAVYEVFVREKSDGWFSFTHNRTYLLSVNIEDIAKRLPTVNVEGRRRTNVLALPANNFLEVKESK